MDIGDVNVKLTADLGDSVEQVAKFKDQLQAAADASSTLKDAASSLAGGLTSLEGTTSDTADSIKAIGSAGETAVSSLENAGEAASVAAGKLATYGDAAFAIQAALEAAAAANLNLVDTAQAVIAAAASVNDETMTMGKAFEIAAGGATSFEEALNTVIPAGSSLEAILQQTAESAATAATGFTATGEAAATAASQLGLFDAEIQVPFADAAGQLNLFTTALEPIEGSATTAAAALAALQTAADGAATGAATYSEAAQAIITKQETLDATVVTAEGALQELKAAFEAGAVSAEVVARAEDELEKATRSAGGALEETTGHVHEAGGALGEAGEKLLQFGEALAITETLKEFGQEALHAADNVTRASIALTAIRGSGDDAKETIEGLEKLGMSDGLSFPSLLTAGTRMQQLLGPEADVAALLGKIADGAAVMGTDIGSAATKFDMLASSGNASAKSLLSLGLNLDKITDALNKVDPSLNATEESSKKLFKELTEEKRIEVLTAALETLDGTAKKVAEETFGGQWQILVNQWDAVMVEAGKALMPIVTGLTDLLKADVLPFIKSLVDGFSALPGPAKEVAIVIAGLSIAIPAVALSAGAFGMALTALGGALEPIGGLLEILGLKSAGAAIGEHAAAEATTELGIAAGGAEGAVTALSGVFSVGLIAGITGAILAFHDLNAAMAETEKQAAATDTAFQKWISALVGGVKNADDVAAAQDKVKQAIDAGAVSAEQGAKLLTLLDNAQKEITKNGFKEWHDQLGISITMVTDKMSLAQAKTEATGISMQKLRDAVQSANDKLVSAVEAYNKIRDAGEDTSKAAEAVAKAQDAASAATKQLETNMNAFVPVVTNVHHATRDFVDDTNMLVGAEEAATDATDAQNIKIGMLADSLVHAEQNLARVNERYAEGKATAKEVSDALDKVRTVQEALNKAIGDAPKPGGLLSPDAAAELAQNVIEMNALLPPVEALPPYVRQITDDFKDLGLKVDDVSGEITNKLFNAFDDLVTKQDVSLAGAEMAWGKVSGAVNKLAQTDLPEAIKQYDLYLQKLIDLEAPEGELLKIQGQKLQAEIAYATESGTSATSQIIALENVKLKQQELYDQTHLLGDLYVSIRTDIDKAWDSLGKGIADNIIAGKNWSDVWHSFAQSVEKSLLEDVLKAGLTPVKDAIDGLISSLTGSLKGALGAAGGGIGGLSNAALGTTSSLTNLQGSLNPLSGIVGDFGKQTTTAAGSVASSASSFLGTFSAVSAGVSAVTGVIGLFQNAAMQATMSLVEANTRISAIVESKELPLANQISVEQENTFHDISTFTSFIPDISKHTETLTDALSQIIALLGGVGQDIGSIPSGGGGTVSLGGDALGQFKYMVADLDTMKASLAGVWSDGNLEVLGLQNINVTLQGLVAAAGDGAASSKQATADFIGLFTNTSQTAKDQWAASYALAQQHYAAAKNTADQIAALKEEDSANQRLLIIAQKEGNADAVAKYTAVAKDIANQIDALQGHAKQTADNTGATTQGIRDQSAAAESGRRTSDAIGERGASAAEEGNRQRQSGVDATAAAAKALADQIAQLKQQIIDTQAKADAAIASGNFGMAANFSAAITDLKDHLTQLEGTAQGTRQDIRTNTRDGADSSKRADQAAQQAAQDLAKRVADLKQQIIDTQAQADAAVASGNMGMAANFSASLKDLQEKLTALEGTAQGTREQIRTNTRDGADSSKRVEDQSRDQQAAVTSRLGDIKDNTGRGADQTKRIADSATDAVVAQQAAAKDLADHIASLKQQIIDATASANAALAAGNIGMAANFSQVIKTLQDQLTALEGTAQGTRQDIRINTRDGADSSKRVEESTTQTRDQQTAATTRLGDIRDNTGRGATSSKDTSDNTATTATNTRDTASAAGATRDQTRRVADSTADLVVSNRDLVTALTKTTASVDTSQLLQNIWEATNHSRVTLEAIYSLATGDAVTLQGIMMGAVIMTANSWQLVRDADQSLAIFGTIRDNLSGILEDANHIRADADALVDQGRSLVTILEDANHIRADADALVDQGRAWPAVNTHMLVDLDGILLGASLSTAAVQNIDHAIPGIKGDLAAITPAITAEGTTIATAVGSLNQELVVINGTVTQAAISISQSITTGLQTLGTMLSTAMGSVQGSIDKAASQAAQSAADQSTDAKQAAKDIMDAIGSQDANLASEIADIIGKMMPMGMGTTSPYNYTGAAGSGGGTSGGGGGSSSGGGAAPPKYGPGSPGYKSPYEQTGSADPKNYVENMTQGSIEQMNHDNSEAIKGYNLAYHDYVLNMSQGSNVYVPPERRNPPVPPLEEILGPPDQYGVPYPVPGSNPVTGQGPAVPYTGPAQPYEFGGLITQNQMGYLHQGEWVLTKAMTDLIMRGGVISKSDLVGGSGTASVPTPRTTLGGVMSGGDTYNIGITINGMGKSGRQLAEEVAQHLPTVLRAASPKFSSRGK